jgi:pimeloyl-ACP methyl ester carboxylesterase
VNTEDIVGRYVRVDGTRVHYDELGEGPAVLLLHTLCACSLEWMDVMVLLAERGYRAIAIDLPGNSRSYPPGFVPLQGPDEYAEFLLRFTDVVAGDERPVLSGCSIGGNMTIALVIRAPHRFDAAIAFEGGVFTPSVAPLDDFEVPASFPGWPDFLERAALDSLASGAPPERVAELRWQHRFTGPHAGLPQVRCWTHHDLRGQCGPTHCPLLVLAGSADFYVPVEFLQLTKLEIPNCEVRLIDGLGHYPMVEDPALTADLIATWAAEGRVACSPRIREVAGCAPPTRSGR